MLPSIASMEFSSWRQKWPMDRRFLLVVISSFVYILLYNGACYSFPMEQNCTNNIDIRLINVQSGSKDTLQDSCCLTNNDFNLIFQSHSRDSFLRLEACSVQDNELPGTPFEPLLEFVRSRKEPPDECSTNFFHNINTLKWLYLERCEVNLSFVKNLLVSTRKLQILRLKKNKFRDISDENFRYQNQLLRLEISYNEIKYLANKTFYGLTNLERLILNHNRISDIAPDSFSRLKNLRVLDLGYNKLKSLALHIFSNNSNLEYLYINGNHLTFLPENTFYSLTKLTKLFIQNNNIANMPENIFKTQVKLNELYMNQNDISRLPESIFAPLENLLILNLAQNNFSLINNSLIKHLKKLTTLDLSHNEILIFPIEVMNFINLTTLSLKGNRIVNVPENIFSDNAISFLDLDKNEIEDVLLNFEHIKHDVHVKINYNRRNISSINLNMANETKHQITIELVGNHISCNAYLEYYNTFFIPLQNPIENITLKFGDGNYESRCYEPEFLKDRSIKDVSLTEAMQQLYGCPDECDCYLRHLDGFKVVNCSYRNLDYFPKLNSVYQNYESEYTAPNSIELNMTGNLLTKVTEDDVPLDYNKEKVISNFKVYLSNNRIKQFTWVPKSNLEVITLDGNRLEYLKPEVLESFKYLSNLTLFNNPWNCECSLALPLWNFLHGVKNVRKRI